MAIGRLSVRVASVFHGLNENTAKSSVVTSAII